MKKERGETGMEGNEMERGLEEKWEEEGERKKLKGEQGQKSNHGDDYKRRKYIKGEYSGK